MRDEVACISFVRKNTTIPTPCLLFRPRRRTEYICIEEIAGVTLESQLEHMTIPELDCVASQLRSHIGQLRKLESRGISSVNGGPLRSCYLWDPPKQPLRKVGEFNQHLREAFRRVYRSSERGDRIVECFPMNSAITFTHGDIGPQNIILQGSTVFLIDWGVSGWWPEYWEYCRMRQ
ncbi:hypothetical protein BOTBODRAFT_119096 [Botryobasidium botryosum FD-172 SS1]|uniref:Aminoglycoside phosphotransferase domain-containing protein n=1 Tax=Botryobasidium botryosum (strain FD-172 SS1) TaxID=930990 RepID=A0A067M098_BOTB1|nr:hypothetical protein BOTBODRAFT_119096 [Botryobasidium botryosum FD-172 SS1]